MWILEAWCLNMGYLKGISGQDIEGVPPCEKRIVLHGHLKQDIPGHKQGNHAPVLSTKQEALDGTPEEDIPHGVFSAPHF